MAALTSPYMNKLKERAEWVTKRFGNSSDEELLVTTRRFFKKWTTQFQLIEKTTGSKQ